ncbi:MAG: Crp/Fnr family transcriptional regulator [Candidatus Omnitrophota bacterium]|nr:Crp/Fnr family transcriptional regulator [Candidatus Omnitrophota bacterium]MDZ4242892.1 Crp/Fnr family transcriptional regulator [Candidatus Omnitrophota bacterium]
MAEHSASIPIADIPLFRGLSPQDLRAIQSCLIEKRLTKGQFLYTEGDGCQRILIVRSGRIKIFKMSAEGREQILEVLNAGDTCACNPGKQNWCCSSSAQALTDCVVWYLPREQYVRLVQDNSRLSRALIQLLAERLFRFGSLIEQVSLNDTQKRLARFILDMNENSVAKRNHQNLVSIPFTRGEIAQRVGSTRETVTRHLNAFKKAGYVEILPGEILIRDVEGLRKISSQDAPASP